MGTDRPRGGKKQKSCGSPTVVKIPFSILLAFSCLSKDCLTVTVLRSASFFPGLSVPTVSGGFNLSEWLIPPVKSYPVAVYKTVAGQTAKQNNEASSLRRLRRCYRLRQGLARPGQGSLYCWDKVWPLSNWKGLPFRFVDKKGSPFLRECIPYGRTDVFSKTVGLFSGFQS